MFFSRISSAVTRGLATNASRQGFLKSTTQSVGRRFMSRSNADISMTETVMWLVFGGVPFTVFGIYQTAQIKARVEAYDAGEIVPIKTLSNDEWLEFKEKVKERMALLEDEDEDDDDEDED
uniref:Uncharacterized protein n=1 Tax=Ciona savignyi TaxID=51511 RepID=H2ZAP1_CIOSA